MCVCVCVSVCDREREESLVPIDLVLHVNSIALLLY